MRGVDLGWERDLRGGAGISVRYQLNALFLKTDLLYYNKGFKTDITATDAYGNSTAGHTLKGHFHYLTLPLLVGVSIKETGFFLNAGPYVGRLLKMNYTHDLPEETQIPSNWQETSSWNRFDYGVSGGVGYSRSLLGFVSVSAEIRQDLGLRNLVREGTSTFKINSTTLLLGAHYTLGGK